jgi:hypothetical protein
MQQEYYSSNIDFKETVQAKCHRKDEGGKEMISLNRPQHTRFYSKQTNKRALFWFWSFVDDPEQKACVLKPQDNKSIEKKPFCVSPVMQVAHAKRSSEEGDEKEREQGDSVVKSLCMLIQKLQCSELVVRG